MPYPKGDLKTEIPVIYLITSSSFVTRNHFTTEINFQLLSPTEQVRGEYLS
jgi:hypothetical protein